MGISMVDTICTEATQRCEWKILAANFYCGQNWQENVKFERESVDEYMAISPVFPWRDLAGKVVLDCPKFPNRRGI
jgi:hypothetical protein